MQNEGCGAWIFFGIMVVTCALVTIGTMRCNLVPWDNSYDREVQNQFIFSCLAAGPEHLGFDIGESVAFCACQYYLLREDHTIRYIDKQITRLTVMDAEFESDLGNVIGYCLTEIKDKGM